MGDMADDALDRMMDEDDAQQNGGFGYTGLYGDGLNDDGESIQWVFSRQPKKHKPCGPGKCPKCGAATKKKAGAFGLFYGCTRFPDCNGSRDVT